MGMAGAGMAASAVGNEMQGWAAALERDAMVKAFQNELNRQQVYKAQGMGAWQGGALGWGSEEANKEIATGAQQRKGQYQQATSTPMGPGTSYSQGPTAADTAYGNMLGGAKAQLGGYSDWLLNKSINDLKTQQQLNQISSFAGGQSRNVYPYNLYSAQHSQDVLSQLGQSISAIGGAASNYGALSQGAGQMPQQSGISMNSTTAANVTFFKHLSPNTSVVGYFKCTATDSTGGTPLTSTVAFSVTLELDNNF